MPQITNIDNWNDAGLSIKDEMIQYNWDYRKKICVKCTDQKRLDCRKYNNFRDGIPETHCRNLINARTKKFNDKIEGFLQMHPSLIPINDGPTVNQNNKSTKE